VPWKYQLFVGIPDPEKVFSFDWIRIHKTAHCASPLKWRQTSDPADTLFIKSDDAQKWMKRCVNLPESVQMDAHDGALTPDRRGHESTLQLHKIAGWLAVARYVYALSIHGATCLQIKIKDPRISRYFSLPI
jgi:hypothetical protein